MHLVVLILQWQFECWVNILPMFIGSLSSNVTRDVLCFTLRPSSAVAMVYSLPIVWLSARSGCCFPSYLHLTLTVFHQLIIPLRYLTINFGISLFSPYSASFAPSPLQGPSNFIHFQSGVDHQSLLFCLRAYILAALVHIMVGYGCLLRWLFFTFPILFASCL